MHWRGWGGPTSLGAPAAPPGSGSGSGSFGLTTRRRPAPAWNIYRHRGGGGPGRRGGPLAAAMRSAGPGHPAPLAVVTGCGHWAERKPAGPTRQPPRAGQRGGHRRGEGGVFASLRFLTNGMARRPVSLRHRPPRTGEGAGPSARAAWGEGKARRRCCLGDQRLGGASESSPGGSVCPVPEWSGARALCLQVTDFRTPTRSETGERPAGFWAEIHPGADL